MLIHSGVKGPEFCKSKMTLFFVSQFVIDLIVVTRYGIRNLYKFLNFCNMIIHSEEW